MAKRQYSLLIITVMLFAAILILEYNTRSTVNIEKYANKIEQNLQQQESEVDAFFGDKDAITELLSVKNSGIQTPAFEKISKKDYTLIFYQNDSTIFWSNNHALPPLKEVKSTTQNRSYKFIQLENGYYELIKQIVQLENNQAIKILGLIPIKHKYNLTSKYLKNNFIADKNIPESIKVSSTDKGYPVKNMSGNIICFLQHDGKVTDKIILGRLLCLYLAAFFCLCLLLNNIAKKLNTRKRPWQGALFLMVVVFGIRYLTSYFGFTDRFSELTLFSKNFNTPLSNSLGDLLINIIILLWMMIFFHKEFKTNSFDHLSKKVRFGLTVLNYFSILAGLLLVTGVLKSLVLNTPINFAFDNVFNLDRYSLLAILGVIVLLIALFFFSHRMMLTILKLKLTRNFRFLALLIASFLAFPILVAVNPFINLFYLILIGLVFSWIFDLFIESGKISFTWLIIWLVILSGFPAILLFKYNSYKDRIVSLTHAKELAEPRDNIAEKSFEALKYKIGNNEAFNPKPQPFTFDLKKLRKRIDQFYLNDPYLFYNYAYDIFAYNKYNEAAIEGQTKSFNALNSKLDKTISLNEVDRSIKFLNNRDTADMSQYFLDLVMDKNPDNALRLVFEFKRKKREQSKVYTELLEEKQYKELKNLDRYDYAIYKNGEIIDQSGKLYEQSLTYTDIPKVGKFKEFQQNNRSELIYAADNNIIVLIGQKSHNIFDAVSLFSYIFALLVLLVLCFSMLNSIFAFFPDFLRFSFGKQPSLKGKIQIYVISLVIISFFVIGLITIVFSSNNSEDYHNKRLVRKSSSVTNDAAHSIDILELSTIESFAPIIQSTSNIHRMDINLYNLNGDLVNSSENDIFDKGIFAKKMNSNAYIALASNSMSKYDCDERIGNLTYQAAFVPLLNNVNKKIGYLELPYYSKQSNTRKELTVFLSTLLNFYVFLLLIAAAIAILVSNSITKPISEIGTKLKQFKLGHRNERLEWHSDDELGQLITDYNRMIEKLEENAETLKKTEREGAWREMAKQVAHEIKNPLTPMKLSIQYLQHAFRSNPDNIEPLLKRVSGTLIEQIDNLAHIASEFSNFAKMPRAENQKIILNTLVESVFDLFSERNDMDLSLHLPEEDKFTIYADRNHLMRVLNNLITNAIQAIPDDRRGFIEVFLYKVGDIATIKVSDNGIGITDDKREKVFVPNFTTKSSGTGLGLAISKNIIESVDGKIYFKTVVGQGTDFFVELPLIAVNELEKV